MLNKLLTDEPTRKHSRAVADYQAGLQQAFPLRRKALFGSWARDEQTETSDVDILVNVDPSIRLRFVTLAERLDALLDQHVDLVPAER